MTNVFEESYFPEQINAAIISLQITLMCNSNEAVAGRTAAHVIEIAKTIHDSEIDQELASLRGLVNQELRKVSKEQTRVYEGLKGLSKIL